MAEIDTSMPLWLTIVCFVLGITLVAGSIAYFVWGSQRIAEASDWPSVEGRVLETGIEESSDTDDDGTTHYSYTPTIAYRYTVSGRAYRGRDIWLLGETGFSSPDEANDLLRAYPRGGRVEILYDPANPADAALIIEGRPWFAFAFTAMGLFWLFGGWFFARRRTNGPRPTASDPSTPVPVPRCRSCGAPIAWEQANTLESFAMSDGGIGQRRDPPCPRCGAKHPLLSLRTRLIQPIFWITFVALWASGIWFIFFA